MAKKIAPKKTKKPANVDPVVEGQKRLQAEVFTTAHHGRRGRKKEKVALSVRIDQKLMELAYLHIERTGARITDMLERGIVLVLHEEAKVDAFVDRPRFLVERASAEEQRDILAFMGCLKAHYVGHLDPIEEDYRRMAIAMVRRLAEHKDFPAWLEKYREAPPAPPSAA